MTTLYWQIAPELAQRRRQVERMLEIPAQSPVEPRPWKPAAALRDLSDRYELQLQLPGVDSATLDIQTTRNSVTVAGDRPATEGQLIHSEFRTGAFKRSIRLPEAVQHQAATADYSQGLLTLTLPKLTAAPDYRVQVAVNLSESAPDVAVGDAAVADVAVADMNAPDDISVTVKAPSAEIPKEAMPMEEDPWAEQAE